jgi:hypothetical protein
MRVGDRLEGTLLKGIDDCLRCIVILSERYLANQRWARWEFERIAEREKREVYSLIIRCDAASPIGRCRNSRPSWRTAERSTGTPIRKRFGGSRQTCR